MNAKIAVLAGDGVGREIVPEAVKVLKVVAERHGHTFEFIPGDVGGHAIDKVGVPLPAAAGCGSYPRMLQSRRWNSVFRPMR